MKYKIIFTLVLPLLLFLSSVSRADEANVEQQVLAAFDSLVKASKSLDTEAYFKHFEHEKFVGLNSDGTNWNSIDDLKPLIKGGFGSIASVKKLEFTNVKVSVIDAYTAVLVNEYEQVMRLKNGAEIQLAGGGTQVWSKRSGEWKLVSVSASSKSG